MHDKDGGAGGGTQFTCFTNTKVQILTSEELRARRQAFSARLQYAEI
jgi:hypothetical protein